jgi:hypothetical protein
VSLAPFCTYHKPRYHSGCILYRFMMLSQHKFGSNVVEKCIFSGESDASGSYLAVMAEIMVPGCLEKLLDDPFANYVVQGERHFQKCLLLWYRLYCIRTGWHRCCQALRRQWVASTSAARPHRRVRPFAPGRCWWHPRRRYQWLVGSLAPSPPFMRAHLIIALQHSHCV